MYGDFNVEIQEGIRPGDRISIKEFGARVSKSKKDKKEKKEEREWHTADWLSITN